MAKKAGKKTRKTKPKKSNPDEQTINPDKQEQKFPGVGHILGSSKNFTGSSKMQGKQNPSSQQDVDAAINTEASSGSTNNIQAGQLSSVNQHLESQKTTEQPSSTYDKFVRYCSPFDESLVVYSQYRNHVETNLRLLQETDPIKASVMMIKNLNKKKALEVACEQLKTIVENIITDSREEKFRRLKKANKKLSTKVLPVVGCEEFLLAIGFTNNDSEQCYDMNESNINNDVLQESLDLLNKMDAIKRQFCRMFPGENLSVKSPGTKDEGFKNCK